MKSIKMFTMIACALALLAAPLSVRAESCCEKAKTAGKDCEHTCCVEAAKAKKVCEKCNPKKEDKKK
jgi:hypothetical protein